MRFDVKDSDVVVDKSDTSSATTKLDKVKSQVLGTVGGTSVLPDGSLKFNPSISWLAEIHVGNLPPETVAASDWSFGFIQAISLGSFIIAWSGAKSIEGSVDLRILDDTGRCFPDCDRDVPAGQVSAPFTKVRADRFKYVPSSGTVKCDTSDGPGFHVPMKITNTRTSADNFLELVRDSRQICCALVVEDQRETPQIRIIGHSIWDITLNFHYKWVKGEIVAANSSTVKVGDFKFGLPADPDLKKMVDPGFLKGRSYNEVATEELNLNIKTKSSAKKIERDTWGLGTPKNFFKP